MRRGLVVAGAWLPGFALLLGCTLVLGCLLLPGCSRVALPKSPTAQVAPPTKEPVQAPKTEKPKAVLKACFFEDFGTLDFQSSTNAGARLVARNVFNTLVRHSSAGYQIEPELCTKLPVVSADGKTYTFELRSNIRFHDGTTRLLSDDVRFTIERMLDPKASRPNRWVFMPILGADSFSKGRSSSVVGFRKIDDLKFQITLREPDALFLNCLAAPEASILSKTLCPASPEKWVKPHGSGPFRVLSNNPGVLLELGSFSGHYDVKVPALDGIEYRIIAFPQAIAEFAKGSLDVLSVPPKEVDAVLRSGGTLLECQSPVTCYFIMNVRHPAWKDVRVRRALALSVDRSKIVETLLGGRGTAAHGLVPPGVPGGFAAGAGPSPAMDVATARRLIGQSVPVALEAWIEEGTAPELGPLLESMANDVGIRLRVLRMPAQDYAKARKEGSVPAGIAMWKPQVPDAGSYLYPFFSYTNAMSSGYYNVPVQDSLEAGRTTAAKAREQLFQKAERTILAEDVALIPLYHPKEYLVTRPGVKGIVLHPVYGMSVNYATKESTVQK